MRRMAKKITAVTLTMVMLLTVGATPTFAASAPRVEDVEYKGKGVVEVDFVGDVQYKRVKVTLKDNKGKKYRARILKRDDDDIKFKIKKYKKGRTYRITISGVKYRGAGKYTKIKTKVRINKGGKHITAAKAKSIALKNAGLKASQVYGMHVEKDYDDGRYVYDVEFNRGYYEYSYEIHATTGRILDKEIDYDD